VSSAAAPRSSSRLPSSLTPLQFAPFRGIWLSWLTVMLGYWMNEIAAAWTMTSLTRDALWVALVPASGTLPIFLFATLAGALADLVDRRSIVLVCQVIAAIASFALFALLKMSLLSPGLLIGVLLAHGMSFAFRFPSFAAAVSESAPREEIPKAIALNTMATNIARVAGPIVAGGLLAFADAGWVFLFNGVLSLAVVAGLKLWPKTSRASGLPAERLFGAVRLGFRFVRASPAVLAAVNKAAFFFFFSVVALALMPVLAKTRFAGSASTYSLLMVAFGAGAVFTSLRFAWLRSRWSTNRLWRWASEANISACAVFALAPNIPIALVAAVIAGGSWMCVASSMQIAAQSALPPWVRARGIAVHQTAVMGASAAGAIAWGSVASHFGVTAAFMLAAVVGMALTAALLRKQVGDVAAAHAELAGLDLAGELSFPISPEQGPVVIAITFRVAVDQQKKFLALSRESRASRLRHGAISWTLLRDPNDAELFIEHFIFESWADRLRQLDHASQADEELRQRKRALCVEPPSISRWIAAGT
jgi:MFS family permease/quinol monooxygenase YgiN